MGNLCVELCQPGGITSLSCHNFYSIREGEYSGEWKNGSVIFKVAEESPGMELGMDSSRNKIYPPEDEFVIMIRAHIKMRYDMTISDSQAQRLSYIQSNPKWPDREIEMENIWDLLYNNEYIALVLYEKFDIFPKLIGTCGLVYAIQKLNTITGYWHLMTLYETHNEWITRVKIAIGILELVSHLDNDLPEPLLICNVRMENFGVTEDLKKVLYQDLESVHPLSITNQLTGDGSRCKEHSDCDFANCRSFCNLITFKCQHGVVNNNLQIVCERIFLGWVLSGKVVVPGLLVGQHTPRVLIELLELCANPAKEDGTPRSPASPEVRKRLYDLLGHLTL